jgi:hypothetical protein
LSAGGEASCLVPQEGSFDEGADGGLFVGVEVVDGFEVQPEPVCRCPFHDGTPSLVVSPGKN